MTEKYEAPTVVALGDFHEETGVGLGAFIENWWPVRDQRN